MLHNCIFYTLAYIIYIKYSPGYLLVPAVYVQDNVVNYVVGFDVEVGYLMWICLGYVRFYVGGHVAQNVKTTVKHMQAASLHVFFFSHRQVEVWTPIPFLESSSS